MPSRAIILRTRRRERRAAFAREDEWRSRVLLALEPAECPQLAAGQRVDRLRAALEHGSLRAAMGKVDRVPAKRDQFARPQAVPIGDQDHGGVTMAITIPRRGSDQALDFALGQVFARAEFRVTAAARRCVQRSATVPLTVVGATSARCGFVMVFQAFPALLSLKIGIHGTLCKARNAQFTGETAISGAAARLMN